MTPAIWSNRIRREKQTLACMLRLYCKAHHGGKKSLCPACRKLLEHTWERLDFCPFENAKPVCVRCPHNCHASRDRAELRKVMRYAGPRLLWRHPLLALLHILDSKKHPQRSDST
ncbi:MAG: hypothetical protein PWP34_692 [Desulfuromonadales bacterium]|jgi:hypothetical protein|nr:hypothetical protein [Desulfuromonadales bacterium]